MERSRPIAIGAIIFWLACSTAALPAMISGALAGSAALVWSVAYVLCGFVLIYDCWFAFAQAPRPRSGFAAFWMLIVFGFAMVWVSNELVKSVSAVMLVLAARRLPHLTSARNSYLGAIAIELGFLAMLAVHEPWGAIVGVGGAVGATLVFTVSYGVQERRGQLARASLALANAELVATREQLANASRADERLRIARDLHDTLGHHLTALSIQLDVAARRSEGAAAEHIREAHAIARLLLSDVRDVVSELRSGGEVNVATMVKPLCRDYGDLHIHLETSDSIVASDAAQADAILRCVQEVITNTLKHAQARNLWIRITQDTNGIDIHAHDDGRGSSQVKSGHGLIGMRERFEALGGRVETTATSNSGFVLRGFVPNREGA
jgi:signal transduction histidine kinase